MDNSPSIEFLAGDLSPKKLQELYEDFRACTLIGNDNTIILTNLKKHRPLLLQNGSVKLIQTKDTVFYFRNMWLMYKEQDSEMDPRTIDIPGGNNYGFFVIADRSGQKIYLIGGPGTPSRILKFNVENKTFTELPTKLIVPRRGGHMCALIPNSNKIMITGGKYDSSRSTEIFDTENESITLAGEMNFERKDHGIGVLTINDQDRLAVFGGVYDLFGSIKDSLRSVELYDAQNNIWEISAIKMQKVRADFGFKSFKQSEIL